MFKWLMAAAALLAGGTDSVMGLTDLDAAAARHRAQKVDMFSKPTPDALISGRRFKINLRVMRARTGDGLASDAIPAFWDYDAARQMLTLDAREQSWPDFELMLDKDLPHGLNGFYTRYNPVAGKNYVGQNGFGATVVIHRYTITSVALAYPRASFGDEEGMPPPKESLGFHYRKELPIAGDKARTVTAQLSFVVEGTIAAFADGATVKCGGFEGGPSMASRLDISTRYCIIAAKFDRVSFQDGSGNVLAEWTR